MNNVRLQFTLAVLLTLGIFGTVTLLLLRTAALPVDAKTIIEGLLSQLVAVLVFVYRDVFRNPTEPVNPAPSQVKS